MADPEVIQQDTTPLALAEGVATPPSEGQDTKVEQEPSKQAERTFSMTEWSKRESEKDRAAAAREGELHEVIAQLVRQNTDAQLESARQADLEAVRDQEITPAEAGQRQRERIASAQRVAQQRAGDALRARANADSEAGLRIIAAHELAKEHNIEPETLLKEHGTLIASDPRQDNPVAMEMVALRLQNAKLKEQGQKPEAFDSGLPSGGRGLDVSAMSPEEKIAYGLATRHGGPARRRERK